MAADQQRAGLQLPALTGSRRLRSARFTKKQKHTSIANARHWYASILIFSRKKNKLNEGEPSSFDGEEPCAHLSQNHIKWHSFKVLCCVQAVHPLYLCDRKQLRSPPTLLTRWARVPSPRQLTVPPLWCRLTRMKGETALDCSIFQYFA